MILKSKIQKNKKLFVILIIVAAIIIAALVTIPIVMGGNNGGDTKIKTVTAKISSIESVVTGSGNLVASTIENVNTPINIRIDEVKVEEGDIVKEGDVLATLDDSILQKAIKDMQDSIEGLDGQLQNFKEKTETDYIEASIAGRVKRILAEKGNDVESVMSSKGALIVLSIDGKMKVEFKPEANNKVKANDEVLVKLSGNKSVTGTVERITEGTCVVTISDNGFNYGDAVTIFKKDGSTLGNGTLDINRPIEVMGTAGTVKEINVKLNDKVSKGKKLITLERPIASVEYESIYSERQERAELLKTLVTYSNAGAIVANYDGTVNLVNVSDGQTVTASLNTSSVLSDSSNNVDSSLLEGYSQYSGSIGGIGLAATDNYDSITPSKKQSAETQKNEAVNSSESVEPTNSEQPQKSQEPATKNPNATNIAIPTITIEPIATPTANPVIIDIDSIAFPIIPPATGHIPQVELVSEAYYGVISWSPRAVVYMPNVAYCADVKVNAIDGYRWADNIKVSAPNAKITNVAVSKEKEANVLTFKVSYAKTQNIEIDIGGDVKIDMPSLSYSMPDVGGLSYDAAGISTDSSGQALEAVTFKINRTDEFKLDAEIDELDILSIKVGQSARITLDAIDGQDFEGQVLKISDNGTISQGVTTYPVSLSVKGNDKMKIGMSANADIILDQKNNVLVIPVDALQENNGEQFVYVGAAKDTNNLGEKRAVKTGISDGEFVEIVEGLQQGDQVNYIYNTKSNEELMNNDSVKGGMSGLEGNAQD